MILQRQQQKALSVARRNLSASSSRANAIPTENIVSYTSGTFATPNTGYFAAGYTSTTVSTVDRIDYSNDTATASAKGPLSQARYGTQGAISNTSFSYFCGGYPNITVVDRIDHFNDTSTSLTKGPLSSVSLLQVQRPTVLLVMLVGVLELLDQQHNQQ